MIENDTILPENILSENDMDSLTHTINGIRLSAKITDAPCNEMNVSAFINEINIVASDLKISATVIRGEELRERNFGGIYGVGKAASDPPALVVLSHEPSGAVETIAIVGKGIVYDTGGLSIKQKTSMPGMKRDWLVDIYMFV